MIADLDGWMWRRKTAEAFVDKEWKRRWENPNMKIFLGLKDPSLLTSECYQERLNWMREEESLKKSNWMEANAERQAESKAFYGIRGISLCMQQNGNLTSFLLHLVFFSEESNLRRPFGSRWVNRSYKFGTLKVLQSLREFANIFDHEEHSKTSERATCWCF